MGAGFNHIIPVKMSKITEFDRHKTILWHQQGYSQREINKMNIQDVVLETEKIIMDVVMITLLKQQRGRHLKTFAQYCLCYDAFVEKLSCFSTGSLPCDTS